MDPFRLIIRKGFRAGLDSYSAFFENDALTPTGLDGYLRGIDVRTVVIAGLSFDYCVHYSAIDAQRLGYAVFVIGDACRAVGTPPGSMDRARASMYSRGIGIIDAVEVFR